VVSGCTHGVFAVIIPYQQCICLSSYFEGNEDSLPYCTDKYLPLFVDLREMGIDQANWIGLAQNRVQWRAFVNMVMNLWVP
jgi:hypothetical protein